MTWQTEFPTFTDMPQIPQGWEDQSWKNEPCPSFLVKARHLKVYTDFLATSDREYGDEMARFTVHSSDDEGSVESLLFQSDNWASILVFVESYES